MSEVNNPSNNISNYSVESDSGNKDAVEINVKPEAVEVNVSGEQSDYENSEESNKNSLKVVIKNVKSPTASSNLSQNTVPKNVSVEKTPSSPLNLSNNKTKICVKRKTSDADDRAVDNNETKSSNESSLIISSVSCAKVVNDMGATMEGVNPVVTNNNRTNVAKKQTKKKKINQPVEGNQTYHNINSYKEHSESSLPNSNQSDVVSSILTRTIKVEPDDSEFTITNSSELSISEVKPDQPPEKKKRGRPRKLLVPVTISVNKMNGPECGNEKEMQTSIDDGKFFTSTPASDDNVIMRKKRGRPRKCDISQPGGFSVNVNNKVFSPSFDYSKSLNQSKMVASSSQNRRKIIKPKRFGSYESFEFMDVNDRNSFSLSNTAIGIHTSNEDEEDDDDDYNGSEALQIAITEEEDDEDDNNDDDEETTKSKKLNKIQDGGGDSKSRRGRKKGTVKLALGREEDNEFDAFGKNVALQLKKVSLQDALELQIQILSLISKRRLQLIRENEIGHPSV